MTLAAGTRIGAYEIQSMIGAGGMGEVYRANDPRLQRDVAIKVLPPEFARDAERMRRFEFEAQAAGRLSHPNVLAIYDVGVQDGVPYLVSELLEGESLRERLRGGKLSPQRALDYARQAASGLSAAHAAGIVHRDLKPENLFITKDGRLKILDFGLAKHTGPKADPSGATVTSPGTLLGTVAYMSPEQLRGQNVDHRCDIFSFGCVLHEMLTGEQPFKAESSADQISATLHQERPDLPISGGFVPAIDRILGHCLEKHPEARFQSAQDLAFDLASISDLSSIERAAPPMARRWSPAAVAAALVVLIGIGAASFVGGRASVRSITPEFQRLTFRRGIIESARFAPDGQTVLYSAIWESDLSDVFSMRLGSPESRGIGFRGAALLGISRSGELALAFDQKVGHSPYFLPGRLATVPFSGGAPRPVADQISAADWTPDGNQLAVTRQVTGGVQLEFPPGQALYKTTGYISQPRISPNGTMIAFWDHPIPNDSLGSLVVVDTTGQLTRLTGNYSVAEGLAWSPKGKEIWFSAAKTGANQDIWAVTLSGRVRLIWSQSASMLLYDIAADGRALVAGLQMRTGMSFRSVSGSLERDISWLDWSLPSGMSANGKLVVFSETGHGGGEAGAIYIRETNGAAAVKLGSGSFAFLSPDAKQVISVNSEGSEITVYPVGIGTPRRLRIKGCTFFMAGMLSDGRIWFDGTQGSGSRRTYVTTLDGAAPRAITPEDSIPVHPFVVEGTHALAKVGGKMMMFPVDGGEAKALPQMGEGEHIAAWIDGSEAYFVYDRNASPTKVYRVDRKSGRRTLHAEITLGDRSGVGNTGISLLMTADGKNYLAVARRVMAELYLAKGLE